MKIYSERFPIKYLISDKGVCLGVDTKKRSFLFIICGAGMMFRQRPVGDKIVENLDYEIMDIYNHVWSETGSDPEVL